MPDAPDLSLRSSDHRFGLELPGPCLVQVLRLCEQAGLRETGGILVGYYTLNLDCAIVTKVVGPTSDSHSTRTQFYRGVAGLQARLDEQWEMQRYYLGEWHYHPLAMPDASPGDRSQMAAIAASSEYNCPEPVLMIVGGDPRLGWNVRAYVQTVESGLTVLQ